jgi:CRISPR-associated protein Csb1
MKPTLDLSTLHAAVRGTSAAFRSRTVLQPAGGEGDKVFPPTYTGAIYATEERRVKSDAGSWKSVPCVLLDSVQSQANRLEEALQQAIDEGTLAKVIPVIEVDFSGASLHGDVRRVTSLEAPHRASDAILRDGLLDGVPFRKSVEGEKLNHASLSNATPLYEICPTALIFGIWDSTGPKGGLGAKFQRAIVSEIVGVNSQVGVKTGSRIDPLQIRAAAKVVKSKEGYVLAKDEKEKGAVSPSEVNHGNIPPDISPGGVTLEYAEQTTVLSLPALRRLRFPINDGALNADVDAAGRTVLAALALAAAALAVDNGLDLRSRCLLWPVGPFTWELLEKPGEAPREFTITRESSISLLNEAIESAEALGLKWRREPLKLTPAPQLVDLLRRSQEIAAAEAPDSE